MRWGVGGGERRSAGAGEVGFGRVNWWVCGEKQRVLQVLAWCKSSGRGLEGQERWKGDAGCWQRYRRRDLSDLPLLGMMSCGGGVPEFAGEPERPCLCLHQAVKRSSEVQRLQESS